MIKKYFGLFLFCFCTSIFAQNLKAKDIIEKASKEENIESSINFIKVNLSKITDNNEKRSLYILLATLQEQYSLFEDAQKSYAQAAAIPGGDSEDFPKKTNHQLVMDAIRCALSSGDYQNADNYLNSPVRNSKNPEIQAHIKLYTQWSALCKANSIEDLQEPIVMLQAYSKLESMTSVQPAILLTLWYITGEKTYSNNIKEAFPNSIEAAIVKGDVQILPTPFWFFVPKKGLAEQGSGSFEENIDKSNEANKTEKSVQESKTAQNNQEEAKTENTSLNSEKRQLQLGLFKTQSNADALCKEVQKKGFNAYIEKETRSSGNTYFLVLVDETSQDIADRLRSSGYECYLR